MSEVRFMVKPEYVTYEMIQALLTKAHRTNSEKGMKFATETQSVDTLKKKIESDNGVCYVAMIDDQLVGTMTIAYRKLHYWYHQGDVAIIKLTGVDPACRGKGIAKQLSDRALEDIKKKGIKVIVTDSAENNIPIRNWALSDHFRITDYCLYKGNNFYTNVYVKWLDGCPYSDWYRKLRYGLKKAYIRIMYKPGKINRFTGKQG